MDYSLQTTVLNIASIPFERPGKSGISTSVVSKLLECLERICYRGIVGSYLLAVSWTAPILGTYRRPMATVPKAEPKHPIQSKNFIGKWFQRLKQKERINSTVPGKNTASRSFSWGIIALLRNISLHFWRACMFWASTTALRLQAFSIQLHENIFRDDPLLIK